MLLLLIVIFKFVIIAAIEIVRYKITKYFIIKDYESKKELK